MPPPRLLGTCSAVASQLSACRSSELQDEDSHAASAVRTARICTVVDFGFASTACHVATLDGFENRFHSTRGVRHSRLAATWGSGASLTRPSARSSDSRELNSAVFELDEEEGRRRDYLNSEEVARELARGLCPRRNVASSLPAARA